MSSPRPQKLDEVYLLIAFSLIEEIVVGRMGSDRMGSGRVGRSIAGLVFGLSFFVPNWQLISGLNATEISNCLCHI